MPYATLRQFIEALEAAGELHRVTPAVSPLLEVTEIADRVSKSPAARLSDTAASFDPHHAHLGGKALLFEQIEGAEMPLAINLFGSYRRLEMALGCESPAPGSGGGFPALAERIAQLLKPEPPTGLLNKVKKGLELARLAALAPKVVRTGRCQEIVIQGGDIDLLKLPVLKCWPEDGDPSACGFHLSPEQAGTAEGRGRYITLAGVYTIHPDDAGKPIAEPRPSRNVGMYRAQLVGPRHTAMHWHMHHDGARHWRAWKKLGKPMPCAIVLGGESVLPYAATAPMPPGMSELLLAGLLNDAAIELVPCKTIDLHVPANAELVIEGYVSTEAGLPGMTPADIAAAKDKAHVRDPQGMFDIHHEAFAGAFAGAVLEGPFGDHTGFYSLPDRYPIFEATAITHCREPIYPTTIVGLPPQEDYYLGKATERLFLPLLQTLVPDVIDYHLPMFGAFHNCAFLKIRKEYPLQARRVMHAIWGAGQMAWTKLLIVVDEDVDVHDQEQVLFHLCANCDPGRDLELVRGPLDILDHAAPQLGAGSKLGFDATRKIAGEAVGGHAVRDWPGLIRMDEATRAKVTQRWEVYGF